MIQAIRQVKWSLQEVAPEDISAKKRSLWIDCANPSNKELGLIGERLGLDHRDLREFADENESPRAIPYKQYSLVIFKAPFFEKESVSTTSVAVLFNDSLILTLHRKEIKAIQHINDEEDDRRKEFISSPGLFLYRLMDEAMNEFFTVIDPIDEKVDELDSLIFKRQANDNTIRSIFSIKKTLIYFHKAFTANRDVVSAIEKRYLKHIKKNNLPLFSQIYHDITQLIDMGSTHREIMTGTLDFYLTSVSNNLNVVMKRLTAYGAIVLVPTFISGFYGMNFRYIPGLRETYGWLTAVGLMAFSVMFLYTYFKKKKYL